MSPTAELSGKVFLVIGAGRPLGRALALGLGQAGASVAAHDLLPTHLDETIRLLEQAGAPCQAYTGDTGKGLAARALVDDVLTDWGRLDALVHCLHAAPLAGLLALDEWDWQRTLEINLSGPFLLMQAAAAAMREQGGGTLVNVLETSPAGHSLALDASQHGLAGLSRAVAAELLTYNINIAAVDAAGAASPAALVEEVIGLCRPAAEPPPG